MNIDSATKDTQSRKWFLTVNNPNDWGYSHDMLKEVIGSLKSLVYWCMSDEIGEQGTYHTHIFVVFSSAVRFGTIKKRLDKARIEMAKGTSQQCRDYIFKEGKFEKDKKKETNLTETHEEYGEIPVERPGARNDLEDLYDMVNQGMSIHCIIKSNPQYSLNIDKIERLARVIIEEKYSKVFRELEVTYVFGQTGTGKTKDIMEKYGYENVFRVTDYKHPFDLYKNQDIIVFEEFRSSLSIQSMLNYLDGYPLDLPCRYSNKLACFTKVFITTNIPLTKQYLNIQQEEAETWQAFLRRIHKIKEYSLFGVNEYSNCSEYLSQLEIDDVFSKPLLY